MKNLFEDFTTLRWVKWNTRQPDWNGSVLVRWNQKLLLENLYWLEEIHDLNGYRLYLHKK